MQVTMQELQKTSLFQAAAAEAQETRRKAEMDAAMAAAEAQRMRAEAGKLASAEVDAALAKYEVLRKELHEQLHKLWASSQAYSRITNVLPPQLPLNTLNSVNLPKLDGSHYESGFSSTRGSIMAYMGSNGRTW